jgi:hypothetical protein
MLSSLFACSGPSPEAEAPSENSAIASDTVETAPAQPVNEATPEPPPRPLIGEAIALAEWRKADNRAECAPLALVSDVGGNGTPRRANFSGGWAVAFDRPNLRSAYGFAGPGLLPDDGEAHEARVAALEVQWPYMRHFRQGENLPDGSAAGYGLEGAEAYSAANPDGRGQDSLAYLRIPGQACQYNIWSKLGRAHLEALLSNLRVVKVPGR